MDKNRRADEKILEADKEDDAGPRSLSGPQIFQLTPDEGREDEKEILGIGRDKPRIWDVKY